MVNFKRKELIPLVVFASVLICVSILSPFLRTPIMPILRLPLVIGNAIGREIKGIVFYHRNYVQNERLRGENDFLNNKLSETTDVFLENKRLHELLELKQSFPYRALVAKVIGRDPVNWSSLIFIDKGSSQGIRKGFVCVSFLGLVGRVVETQANTSKVMVINDPNISITARVQRSRQEGLVCGSLAGSLLMKFLPKDSDIVPGDSVVTSGITDVYPKGLIIGTVLGISDESSGVDKYAIIKPAVDFSALEEILVVVR